MEVRARTVLDSLIDSGLGVASGTDDTAGAPPAVRYP